MQKRFWHKVSVNLFFVCTLLIYINVYSQDSTANGGMHTFFSLEQAMKQPDSVISLTLKKQHLKEFPQEILQMKNLERLDLSRNSIKEIPAAIGELKKLHYVNFAQNYLTELPEEMAFLPIDTLILWDNQIRKFSESFKSLPLKFLDLRAILMTRKEQKAIKQIFPAAKIRKDHPCNCGR